VHHLPPEVFRDGESHDTHRSSHVADDSAHLSAAKPARLCPKPSTISLLSMVSTSKWIATRVAPPIHRKVRVTDISKSRGFNSSAIRP
jgi:hypothetical protein